MEFTLESGKKVNYEKPSFKERAKIWDDSAKAFNSGLALSLETCAEILTLCKVCSEKELNEDKFSIEEVYEIGAHILNEIFSLELNKKK